MSRVAIRAALVAGARPEADVNNLSTFLRIGTRRIPLEDSQGVLTQNGRLFQELAMQLGINPETTVWRKGTSLVGRDTVAFLIDGTRKVLRRWDALNNREIQTQNGDSYYAQFRDEFLVNLPVFRHVRDRPKTNDNDQLVLPITKDELSILHPGLSDIRRVPANAPVADQRRWIRDALEAYLDAQPRDENGDVVLINYSQSSVWFTWDQNRGTTFDELRTDHVQNADALHPNVVQAILNRPLQGIPICPTDMYNKHGVTPIGWEDTRTRGGCILNQLLMVLNKQVKVKSSGSQSGGVDTRKRQWVPMYTMEELTKGFQTSFDEVYPGRTATLYGPKSLTTVIAERRELEAAKELYRQGRGKRPLEEVDESIPVREAPYDLGDWRELGLNCKVIEHFCKKVGLALRILHSNRVIQEFSPPDWKPNADKPIVCLNVWSDHGFIYSDPESKRGISHMRVVKPQYIPPNRLAKGGDDDDDKVDYSEMVQYTTEAVEEALGLKHAAVFYTTALKEVQELLTSKKITFKVFYGSTPNLITSLTVKLKKRKCIKIRGITPEHAYLNTFCKTFSTITRRPLVYKGESMPFLMHRAINAMLVKKRHSASVEDMAELIEKQGNKCKICGDSLSPKHREVDHIIPLGEGGGNEVHNLQILCKECHATKTEREENSNGNTHFHTLESQLSPHLVEVFHESAKPMQFTGAWNQLSKDADYCNCLDVVGCRSNAIFEYEHGLPIFSPLDQVERIMDEEGFMVRELKDYAVIYVNCPDVDLEDKAQAEAAFPWTGSRWYVLGAVLYMLQTGCITTDNLLYGIRPARRLNPSILKETFVCIHEVMDKAMENHLDDEEISADLAGLKKRAILSTIGLWNSTERLSWKVVRSQYVEDALAAPQRREYVGDGLWDFKVSQIISDNRSMRGIGQIALDMELVYMDMMIRALKKMPNIRIVGGLVDGLFFVNRGFDNPVRDFVAAHKFPSGKHMFQIKVEEPYKVPRHPFSNQERTSKVEEVKPWTHLFEHSGVDLVDAIIKNGGGMILGPGGVGKTVLINSIIEALRANGEKVHTAAMRHAAKALLRDGKTIRHLLHKFKDARDFWAIFDEGSEISLALWADLSRWKLVGVKFIIVGDFEGQLTPIMDRWKDAMHHRNIQDSDFMNTIAGASHNLPEMRG